MPLEIIDAMCCLIYFFFPMFIALAFFFVPMITGQIIEKKHLRDLDEREKVMGKKIITHNRRRPYTTDPTRAMLVAGSVCIGADRFKTWLAGWRQIIGGKMGSLSPVVERARREATLRMIEDADRQGCTEVGNIRYTTANLKWNSRKQKELLIVVTAYGTGYVK